MSGHLNVSTVGKHPSHGTVVSASGSTAGTVAGPAAPFITPRHVHCITTPLSFIPISYPHLGSVSGSTVSSVVATGSVIS